MITQNLISMLETKKEALKSIMLASYQEGNIENYNKYESEILEIDNIINKLKG
jgi:hypothetical protein